MLARAYVAFFFKKHEIFTRYFLRWYWPKKSLMVQAHAYLLSNDRLHTHYQESTDHHGAAFRKLICISGSISHTSKSVVVCFVSFSGGTSDRRRTAYFPRVEPEWNKWMRHLSCSLCLCSANFSNNRKTAVFCWNVCAPVVPPCAKVCGRESTCLAS